MKALTVQEMDKLLTSIADVRLRCMVLLAARHGLRASEATGLLMSDIDLTAKTITCRRLKGSLTNTQTLGESELTALREWLQIRKEGSKYVFPGVAERPVSRITFWRQFHAACVTANVRVLSPHSLKHHFAYRLVEANVSLPIIQAACGHASISSTAIYAKPSSDTIDKAMRGVFDAQ